MVDNPDHRLAVGMSAQIIIDLGRTETVAVPGDVLIRSGSSNQAEVLVVQDGRVHRREVRLGTRLGELVEITEGLNEGELVVRSGGAGLTDGQQVTLAGGPEAAG